MFSRPSERRYAAITEEYKAAIQRGIPEQIRALGQKRLQAALFMEENRIIPDVTENVEIIDDDGDVLLRKRAGLLSARITKDKMANAIKQGGVIMTHNHPALYSMGVIKQPPSWSDFRFVWSKGLDKVRTATATGTWEIDINCPHTQENFNTIQNMYVNAFKSWARWTKTNHPVLHAKNPLIEIDTGSAVISDKPGKRYAYSKPTSDPLGIIWAELAIHAWTEVAKTGMVLFTFYPEPNMKTSLADWGGMFIPGKTLPPMHEAPMPPRVPVPQQYRSSGKSLADYANAPIVVPVVPKKYVRRQL
jgi:hypothetical protein